MVRVMKLRPCAPADRCVQDSSLNPFTNKPHTPQYKKLLETRRKLPVFGQMDELLKMVLSIVQPISMVR